LKLLALPISAFNFFCLIHTMNLSLKTFITCLAIGLFVVNAHAITCSKAQTKSEKIICENAELLKLDAELNIAYAEALKAADEETRKALPMTQKFWLSEISGNDNLEVIKELMAERLAYLSVAPTLGTREGASPTPFVRAQFGKTPKNYFKSELFKFKAPSTPSEIEFNAQMDEISKVSPVSDLESEEQYSDLHVRMIFSNKRTLAASYEAGDFLGGAHPNWYSGSFYLNRATGKEIHFEDVFQPDAIKTLYPACLVQADDPRKVDDLESKNLKAAVADLRYWEFNRKGANLSFQPYSLAGYAQDIYGCDFDRDLLIKLLKPEFAVWEVGK
jgi:uncharacterized protein